MARLNITVQVRVTADPTVMVLLLMVMFGVGTRGEQEIYSAHVNMYGDHQTSLVMMS